MGIFDILGIHFPFANNPQPGLGQRGVVPFNNPKPSASATRVAAPSTSSMNSIPGLPVYNESYSAMSPLNPYAKINQAVSAKSSVPNLDMGDWVDPYAGFDPEAMAKREFDPQFALIKQMEGQATKKYTKAGADVKLGWDLLAKGITGREKGIKADTTTRGKNIGAAFGGVSKTADKSIDTARAELIANAQRTGTMEQIAPLLAQLAGKKAEMETETGGRQGNWAAFNAQMGQNSVQENQLAADTAKWGGLGAQADFANRLQDALNNLGNKRLELQGNRGAAVNKYGMDIAGGRESSREAWNTLETQRAAQAIEMKKMEAQAAADAAANQPKDIDTSKLTPTEYLAYLAGHKGATGGYEGLYKNPDAAQNAVHAIQDTFTLGKNGRASWNNAAEFVQDVLARNPNAVKNAGGDARQLAQLAQDYYTRLAGGANKPYGRNQYGQATS